jgi:hypothetical protein
MLFDASSPRWRFYGRTVFVEAESREAAEPVALAAAREAYPQAESIPFFMITPSTEEARAAYQARQAKIAQWQENNINGVPNTRGDL